LVLDEVQCGVGRTGTFFAFEQAGVRPHAVTLAKGLANGLPVGALLVAEDAAEGFRPGHHASTFGGNPVACAAACAVVDAIDDGLLANVRAQGARLTAALGALPGVVEARGSGLLLAAALDAGLLLTSAGETTLRLTPPLVVSADEVDEAVGVLAEVLA
jgi:acetylornithine/succinyldiaminopimelate/putrescine aminotransferase